MSSSSSLKRKAPWDRNNKYWCQYCRVYVYDNRSSRNQHESGSKHKDNVQRYLRQIGKETEAKEKTAKQVDAQIAKIEEAAEQQYRQETGAQTEEPAHDAARPEAAAAPGSSQDRDNKGGKAGLQSAVEQAAEEKPSRPADVGVVGAWEVVEEDPEEEEKADVPDDSTAGIKAARRQSPDRSLAEMRGAEWLDDEEKHSHQLTSFDIQEKTVDTATAATGSGDLPGDNGSSTPKTLFKKRRTPANRAARKQQKQ